MPAPVELVGQDKHCFVLLLPFPTIGPVLVPMVGLGQLIYLNSLMHVSVDGQDDPIPPSHCGACILDMVEIGLDRLVLLTPAPLPHC